jgi:integrase
MEGMPRPRTLYLQRRLTRHGKVTWYVRVGRGKLVRLRAEYGTPEFAAEYAAARRGAQPPRTTAQAGTLGWLVGLYRRSTAWGDLAPATRRQRDNILKQVLAASSAAPLSTIARSDIAAGRDRRRETPYQARHFLDTLRGLFRWALDAELVRFDPTAGVTYPVLKDSGGFPVWAEDDVAAYELRWPLGTKERVWLAVLLYTGLRRGDAVRLGRQHVRDGVAKIRTAKSGGKIEVTIPLLPPLRAALSAGPIGELAFICGAGGGPLTKESFGNEFHDACRAAGIRKSAHGLRKIGATRAALNGATVAQLNAIFGWTGSKMASLYTQSADRDRLAREAMWKLNEPGNSVLPSNQAVATTLKTPQ